MREDLFTLPWTERAILAWEALVLTDERKREVYGFGITDSDVLDVIDDWSVECACGEGCDRELLGAQVWAWVEQVDASAD